METIQAEFMNTLERSHTDLYKELETQVINSKSETKKTAAQPSENEIILKVCGEDLLSKEAKHKSTALKFRTDETKGSVLFQRSMRALLLSGQFSGLIPVVGILEDDTSKLRFKLCSLRFLHSMIILSFQIGASIIWWYNMYQDTISIGILFLLSFYATTTLTTCLFLRVATKWSSLAQEVSNSALEEYMDPGIQKRCNTTVFVLLCVTLIYVALASVATYTELIDCYPETDDMFRAYAEMGDSWFFNIIPYNFTIWIIQQILILMTSLSWNYPDTFIICMSIYLSSILERFHEKIISTKRSHASLEFWRSMREDYTRVTRLFRSFDDVVGGVILISFADNTFFICVQLFNILSNGIGTIIGGSYDECPNYPSGPFHGYEHSIYFCYSFFFALGRYMMVSLVASKVHSASIKIAPVLYEIPSSVYCDEVQRFIDQVHSNNLAFSGLRFFYVTKGLILSVANTVVTYELVLLQFGGDENHTD